MRLTAPFCDASQLQALHAGDLIELSGRIFTGRDAAHKRFFEMLLRGEELPFSLQGQCMYYTGPCPAAPGEIIGPCGPTTSGRMDPFTPALLECGLLGMIGKGQRSAEVRQAMARHGAVYFAATGGAAALLQNHVLSARVLAFPELGPEAVFELTVENFPLIVACDSHGASLYQNSETVGATKK